MPVNQIGPRSRPPMIVFRYFQNLQPGIYRAKFEVIITEDGQYGIIATRILGRQRKERRENDEKSTNTRTDI